MSQCLRVIKLSFGGFSLAFYTSESRNSLNRGSALKKIHVGIDITQIHTNITNIYVLYVYVYLYIYKYINRITLQKINEPPYIQLLPILPRSSNKY